MTRKFTIDPNKPYFIYDSRGDWHATLIGENLWDTRGEYIGFVILGEIYKVYTAQGEHIGDLSHDGRIIRKRHFDRPTLLPDLPPTPPKPAKFPVRAPLPPMFGELGFDKIDVLDWDPEIFKRVSDLKPDMTTLKRRDANTG
jgi:hypothetical protein